MRKFIMTFLLVLAVAIPIALGWVLFYPGRYEPPAIETPNLEDISATSPFSYPFAEKYQEQGGTFLVDR